jgi:hypothetical protein
MITLIKKGAPLKKYQIQEIPMFGTFLAYGLLHIRIPPVSELPVGTIATIRFGDGDPKLQGYAGDGLAIPVDIEIHY